MNSVSGVISDRPLRIGIDGEALRLPMTGVGRYVFHIGRELEALLPRAQFFVYARGPADTLALPSDRWQLRLECDARWRRLPSVAWVKWRSAAMARQDKLDLYWAGRTLMPTLPDRVKTISTVHDLNCWVVPETMPFKHRWAHRIWFGRDVRAAHHVVANSLGTATRLFDRLGVRADAVACPGVEACFVPATAMAQESEEAGLPAALGQIGLRPPYLLAVATLEPRKNLAQLLQAYTALRREGLLPEFQLALIGAPGWGPPDLVNALEAAKSQGVVCTGYLPDALMPALYRHAHALVFPSLYEGFGMPVIEARACGTRVVVSDVPELREVAGADGTVVAITPQGLRDGILRSLAGPRPNAASVAQAQAYTWGQAARHMARLFNTACA
jgi:glycosyltransferase involved in cell wall biosynthesis